ncbi:hypothetical protein HEQ62_07740 [Haematospirillum jordaniae]|nr:hypothetical protein [Haematospirillum jordaniae]NKD45323.1 hypothetical protein [Haematospirillum jordaniae]NKD57315.1 hypothetical protein [Haematospirillum jordaniae]NKD59669.1 hypothetical protein [Haematospirillum jordaniae]NKD67241.1 hypothetical protein [Haematospirillum jordaniae]NKD79172.1 hypothetical protein [Haematospirillum jordaniae]
MPLASWFRMCDRSPRSFTVTVGAVCVSSFLLVASWACAASAADAVNAALGLERYGLDRNRGLLKLPRWVGWPRQPLVSLF